MRKAIEAEVKVGLFVVIGLALIMLAILVLGSTENLTSRKNRYYIHVPNAEGIVQGAKVTLGGISVGTIDNVEFDAEKRDIRVVITIARSDAQWVRKDTTAEIATQGMLGDKYIALKSGSMEEPVVPDGSDIPSAGTKDLTQFISKGDKLLVSLNSIAVSVDKLFKALETGNRGEEIFKGMAISAKNLSQASDKLNQQLEGVRLKNAIRSLEEILGKINNGTGTLGALINDPGLYDDAKALMGGANRNRIIRNLVRQTIKKNEEVESKAGQEKK